MLRVWLPLTKDLRQQGLSDTTVTNNGATYSATGGKLGGCYSFNGSSNYLYTTGQGYFGNNYSFSVWVYTTSTSATQTIGCIRTAVGSGFSLFLIGGKLRIDPGGNNVQWTTSYTYPANTWFHFTVTCNNGAIKYYINGEYKESYSTTLASNQWGNIFSIGASQSSGSDYGNFLSGKLNDVRIYDHCLSPMEVKELAKGLILHYPLNRQGWGQENLVTGSNTNSLSTNNWAIGSQTGGNTRTIEQDETGTYCVKFVRDSTAQSGWYYLSYGNLLRNQIKTDTTYTLTFDCKASVNSSITFTGLLNGNATNYMTNSITNIQSTVIANQWCHMKYQCKTISSFENITIGSQVVYLSPQAALKATGVTVYFKNIKLEEGSIATPWCPNSSDTLATTMGLNSTTEYDCSGFCNNGTRTGTFSWTSDTPKYSVSTYMPTAATISHPRCLDNTSQEWTCAAWVKPDVAGNYQNLNNFNESNRLYHSTYPLLYLNSGTNDYYNYGNLALPANQWSHIVFVFKNSTGTKLIYVNGENRTNTGGPNKTSTPKGIPDTVIVGGSYAGYMCDYREYATALSASDVKSLYQNCATIGADGKIYGQIRA